MVGRHRTFAKTRAAQHPPNRPSVYTLDYSSCSNDELRRFIRDRSRDPTMDLQGPPMKQTRAGVKSEESRTQMFLISILEKLDEETTFRFLDLPAEMRNLIYPFLLTRDSWSSNPAAFPNILQTAKLMYKEGSGIFHAESFVDLCIRFLHRTDFQVTGDLSCSIYDHLVISDYKPRSSLFKISNLNIKIELHPQAEDVSSWVGMAAFIDFVIMRLPLVKRIRATIEVEKVAALSSIRLTDQEISDTLRAFSKLPQKVSFETHGLEKKLRDQVQNMLDERSDA